MSCEDIIRALRCISTPGGPTDCKGCLYYRAEHLSGELKKKLGTDEWCTCDIDKIGMDAADRIERLEAETRRFARRGQSKIRMMREGKIPVELTPEQLADLIDAATRAAEQDQEDAEILSSEPRIDRETVGELLETRKRLLTMAAWMQHLWEEAVDG